MSVRWGLLIEQASTKDNPYLFTGRRLDIMDSGSLKIQYSRARYYDTTTGRFLSRDPFGVDPAGGSNNPFNLRKQYHDGMNLYEYVKSDPVSKVDPSGLWSKKYPDPWTSPKDILCGDQKWVSKKVCEAFYDCLIKWNVAKAHACHIARKKCHVECEKHYSKNEKYWEVCNHYCLWKTAKCIAK